MSLYFFAAIWFIRTSKAILFWLYLWQLKEYHIGRFADHFRTAKGRQIFLNRLFGAKLILAAGFFIFPAVLPPLLFALYFFESAKTLRDTAGGLIRKPAFTSKALVLAAVSFAAVAAAGFGLLAAFFNAIIIFSFGLLLLDIFTPVIVSVIVLAFQPLAVAGKKKIIEKAKQKRTRFPNLTVIGITGSYGKTSTKEFLALILSARFNVLKTKEHQNSEVGVAQCILNDLKPEHQVFVCEMGAYGRGGIKLLCDIAKPKIGILTGINEQHMATFGSQENIIKTKFELIEALPEGGTAVVNLDNQLIKSKIQSTKSKINPNIQNPKFNTIRYSVFEKLDVWADDIRTEKGYISFRAVTKEGDSAEFRVNVLGAHYVPNLLAAAASAKEFGMTMAEIAEQCKKITPKLAGMVAKKEINGATVINATYSANPDGVISHLDYLKIWPGRKVIIMPCLIELGKASKEVHQRIGRKIGEVCGLAIITTKERFHDIKTGALESGMKEENILFAEKSQAIGDIISHFVKSNDVVLLEGRMTKSIIERIVVSFPREI